jgi:hypothetical protein
LLVVVFLLAAWCRDRWQRERDDKRMATEIEQLVFSSLRNPAEYEEIAQRYGKFIELTDSRWNRGLPFGGEEYFHWSATAQFENAKAGTLVEIIEGESITLERLNLQPSTKWVRDHPGGSFQMREDYIWYVHDRSAGQSYINGRALHPNAP